MECYLQVAALTDERVPITRGGWTQALHKTANAASPKKVTFLQWLFRAYHGMSNTTLKHKVKTKKCHQLKRRWH
jgi:hypothetical protein